MSVFIQISHPILIIAAFLSILTGHRYFQYRTPTTRWGGLCLISLSLEVVSFSLLQIADQGNHAPFWYILQVTGFYFLILFWLLFITEAAGLLVKIKVRLILPFFLIPPLIQVFLLGRWALQPPRVAQAMDFIGSLSRLPFVIGPYGSFMIFIYYAMGTLSLTLLAWLSYKSNRLYRRLFISMFLGTILIFILDFIDRAGFNLFDSSYLIQFGLAAMGYSLFFHAFILRFNGIMPISRESVFQGIHDGVIILDYYDRVIDINLPAQRILGLGKKKFTGQKFSRVWEKGSRIIDEHPGELWIEDECSLTVDGQAFDYKINVIQNIGLNNSPTGRLVLLRNISEGEHMQQALDRRSRELKRTNSLLETLASLSVSVQPDANATINNDIVAAGLTKLGLVYFIAELDPRTGELVMKHLSALPEKIKWIERQIRNKVIGLRLDKGQFSTLYKNLRSRDILFKKFDPEEIGSGARRIPAEILDQALHLIGLQPQNTILVIPLISGERPLGIMGVWGEDLKETDVPAFQVFASQIAHVMEQAIQHQAEEQQTHKLIRSNKLIIALSKVTSILGTASNSDLVMDVLGSELKKVDLNCAVVSFSLNYESAFIKYSSISGDLTRRFSRLTGLNLEKLAISHQYWPDDRLIRERTPVWYDDIYRVIKAVFPGMPEEISMKVNALFFGEKKANLCLVPLFSGERIDGALAVWGVDMMESDSPILNVFGHQVAGILRNLANLESEVQRTAELTRSNNMILALSSVASQLDAAADLPQVFSILGNELKKMGLKSMIGTLDDEKQNLKVEYVSVLDDLKKWSKKLGSFWPEQIVIPRRLWPTEKVTDEKEPYWDSDPVTNISRMFPGMPRLIFEKTFEMTGIKFEDHVCYLPVISQDNPIGIFAVWGENLHKEDIHVLTVFSSQVAGIIARLKSFEEEVRRSKKIMHTSAMVIALSNVAAQLDTTTDLPRIFETLGKELSKVQIHCMVGTLDDSRQNMKVEYLSDMMEIISKAKILKSLTPDAINVPRRLWPTEKAISEKTPFWDPNPIGSVYKMFPFVPRNLFLKVFSMAGLNPEDPVCYFPLINEEDVIGILAVWGPELNPEDLNGFSVFASQLAAAIKTTRLYALAQNEILERIQAEGQIRSALEEKEILLKEIHHRVKNNLQIITSLLNLQAAEVADERTMEALRESQNRLRSMALIHEKLYQSNDLARIDFAGYVESLVLSLSQTYLVKPEKITFNVYSEPITLNIDLAIPCGLIINELVSNSVKYAFPGHRTGVIQVKLARNKAGNWTLAISDNGIGLPPGFEINKSPSLGLSLVTNLVRQINGEFEIDNTHGTAYRISFDIKNDH